MQIAPGADFEWNYPQDQIVSRLGINKRLQLFFANAALRKMNPYTPFDSGIMAQNTIVTATNEYAEILYNSPYAHYQWLGELMLAPNGSSYAGFGETKHYVGKDLKQNKEKHPLASSRWDKAMWDAHKEEVQSEVDLYRRRISR
jgi:hypothetical protein